MKYTYEDVVTVKDILTGKVKKEDIIGKKGWFLDCIPQDMSLNTIMRLAGNSHTLKDIDLSVSCPFISDETIDVNVYLYFLPEKEESALNLRFKVGDKVFYKGKPAEVVKTDESDKILPYLIHIENMRRWATASEIVPAGPELREKTYKERQAEWIKANNIKEGDKVKILRKTKPHEDGWGDIWVGNEVGKIGVIDVIHSDNIRVRTNTENYWYPYFVLEKVEDEPKAKPSEDHIGSPDFEEIAKALKTVLYTRYVTLHEFDGNNYICGFMDKPAYNGQTWLWGPKYMYHLKIGSSVHVSEKFRSYDGHIDYSSCIIDNEEKQLELKTTEYIPYDLSDAEYRALLRGDWVVSKKTGSEGQIIGFHQIASGEWTADIGWGINATADGLLDGFIFSDGSPVGKLKDMPF